MSQWLTTTLGEVWANIWYYVSLQFVDPFWWWLAAIIVYSIVATLICALLNWYFPKWFSWLKPVAGVTIVIGWILLAGIWIGENMARKHDANKKKKIDEEQPKPRDDNDRWRW